MSSDPVKDINPNEAWQILQSSSFAALIDVRTRMEYEYVGHPTVAIHVPWMESPDWKVDPNFVAKVRAALQQRSETPPEATPILTLCRSGKRSRAAAEELAKHGFTELYNVAEGFEGDRDANKHRSTINGWRYRGLPWEQG